MLERRWESDARFATFMNISGFQLQVSLFQDMHVVSVSSSIQL